MTVTVGDVLEVMGAAALALAAFLYAGLPLFFLAVGLAVDLPRPVLGRSASW